MAPLVHFSYGVCSKARQEGSQVVAHWTVGRCRPTLLPFWPPPIFRLLALLCRFGRLKQLQFVLKLPFPHPPIRGFAPLHWCSPARMLWLGSPLPAAQEDKVGPVFEFFRQGYGSSAPVCYGASGESRCNATLSLFLSLSVSCLLALSLSLSLPLTLTRTQLPGSRDAQHSDCAM